MTAFAAALVLLVLIAVSVTVVDAVRAPHWRVVAVERRQSWRERTLQEAVPTGRVDRERASV